MREKWEAVSMSFERLTDEGPKGRAATSREFRRDDSRRSGIPWNPSAVRSGIRAQHESESELTPGASDLRDDGAIRFNVC